MASLPPYASKSQIAWYYGFRLICAAIFFFLIFPILVILPLSFNAEDFFTFTPKMLALDAEGYSLKHYRDFFTNPDWQLALKNSFLIAPFATLLAVVFGTLAAIGLSQSHVPCRAAITSKACGGSLTQQDVMPSLDDADAGQVRRCSARRACSGRCG